MVSGSRWLPFLVPKDNLPCLIEGAISRAWLKGQSPVFIKGR